MKLFNVRYHDGYHKEARYLDEYEAETVQEAIESFYAEYHHKRCILMAVYESDYMRKLAFDEVRSIVDELADYVNFIGGEE